MHHDKNVNSTLQLVNEVWNQRQTDLVDILVAPDYVRHQPDGKMHGPEGFLRIYQAYLEAFPDMEIQAHQCLAERDLVCLYYTFSGKNTGSLMDHPPTGKRVEIMGMSMGKWADGQLVEEWVLWDTLGMARQLGLPSGSF